MEIRNNGPRELTIQNLVPPEGIVIVDAHFPIELKRGGGSTTFHIHMPTDEERRNFLDGLADVDKQSNELFGKDFAAASASQQLTLLRSMDDAVSIARTEMRRRASNTPDEERDTQLKGKFFVVFKNITLHGYYTSEVAFTKELNLEIIPGSFHGCAAVPANRKA